jgi:predicted dehydrogenase
LVGGAGSGFIGRVHVVAATLDNRAELVAGAFSSDPERSHAAAGEFDVAPRRAYGSYRELIASESRLPDAERVDFVSIATPNHTHFEIAKAAIEAGFNVVCDKPMTNDLQQALQLARMVEQSQVVFVVMHGYTGYPMVRQARDLVLGGELGEIHAVRAHYIQGGLMGIQPGKRPQRGAWKADPDKVGPSGAMADIGSHAFDLLRFTTGLTTHSVSCILARFHPARPRDDYGHALIRCENGALAMITVSQISHGRLNDLSLEVDGTKGSLIWRQESPDQLVLRRFGQPVVTYERNRRAEGISDTVRAACRLPGGHPEGFFEALANVYRDSIDDMIRRKRGFAIHTHDTIYANVYDGVDVVRFIRQCVASSQAQGTWQPLPSSADVKTSQEDLP